MILHNVFIFCGFFLLSRRKILANGSSAPRALQPHESFSEKQKKQTNQHKCVKCIVKTTFHISFLDFLFFYKENHKIQKQQCKTLCKTMYFTCCFWIVLFFLLFRKKILQLAARLPGTPDIFGAVPGPVA